MTNLLSNVVDQTAERTPANSAFRCRGVSLSYEELGARAAALAATLAEAGVRPGDRVGILLPKCLESAVAVFGVLRTGAVYVPLDPAMPASRLRFILKDAGIAHVVTHPKLRRTLRDAATTENLRLVIGLEPSPDRPFPVLSWDAIGNTKSHKPPPIAEDDPAYIMYTSGSTGEPKGILHTHRSGFSYARAAAATYGVRSDDRLGNFAPLHFDQSTFDFFSGPLAGATTVIIPDEHRGFPANLSKLIEDEKLTFWYSVPFALIQLLLRGVLEERDLTSLRWILFGGEPFPIHYLRDLMTKLPGARFSNVYGPAEVNQCTFYHVPELSSDFNGPIPIGHIWDEAEGLVVDENDQRVVDGEIGELLVRSTTMMRGYWQRPELDQKVLYHRRAHNGRVDLFYRTGDLVKTLPDGNLVFLGRKDRQIKTRGYRVELDEVETALLAVPGVEEGAAFAVEDPEAGGRRIDAAVIARDGVTLDPPALRRHVAGRLPAYAVPVRITIFDEFPRTQTGKVDRLELERRASEAEAKSN